MKRKCLTITALSVLLSGVLYAGLNSKNKPLEVNAETSYDLWIAGVQVTEANKNNIIASGEGKSGTASFDSTTNTLSLNDFFIVPQASGSTNDSGYDSYQLKEIGITSKIPSLTINVSNSVHVGHEVEYNDETELADFDFKVGIYSTGDINITGTGDFFVYGGMEALISDNLTIDFSQTANSDPSATFESLTRISTPTEEDFAAVLVDGNVTIDSGAVYISCFEYDGLVSKGDAGNINIKNCQLEIESGKECLILNSGDITIDNSYLLLQSQEYTVMENSEYGNIIIKNHSFVVDLLGESTGISLYCQNKITIEDSRFYACGFEALNYFYSIVCTELEIKGDSLVFINSGQYATFAEGPVKTTMTGGTVIMNTPLGLYGGGPSESDFIIGSEQNPFKVKNGALFDELSEEIVPVTVLNGEVPMVDLGGVFQTIIYPANPEKNDGFIEINIYATVTMPDYVYGGTVSTPSIDHQLAKLWGEEVETVSYKYYAEGETIDDAKEWKDIEPTTLEIGTYYMVAEITDSVMPMFIYESDPVEFKVTETQQPIVNPETDDDGDSGKICFVHWILLGLLVLSAIAYVVVCWVAKKEIFGIIPAGVLIVGSIITSIFSGCALCWILLGINVLVGLIGIAYSIIKQKKKEKEE